jgi:hypothetical protein
MIRIGRVLMFIGASVVSGLALAFLIVAWRPQLVTVQAPAPARASLPDAQATPRPYQPEGTGTVEKSASAPDAQAADSAPVRPGVSLAADAEHPAILFPGHDAWSYADAVQRAGPAVVNT